MADNKTQIIISAEDNTAAGFASAKAGLQQFAGAFSALKGLAAVGIAAEFVASVKATIDLGDSINDLSQRVGVNIKELATWELAAAQSGTNLESVARGVKGLSTFMVANSDEMKKAGITAADTNGALIQLADLFASLPDGVEKTALAVKLFGKSGMDMIPMLNQGSAGLKEASDKAKVYGERMAEMAPKADKFNDQMAELAMNSKLVGIAIADHLLPGLTGMLQWLNDLKAGGDRAATALEFLSEKSPIFNGLIKLNNLLNGGEARSKGYSGEKNLLGLPITAAEKELADLKAFDAAAQSYMTQRDAKKRAMGLLGQGPTDAKAGKTPKVGGFTDYAMKINEAVAAAINSSDIVKAREYADQLERLDSLFFDSGLAPEIYASALEKLSKMTASASDETAQLNRLLDATPTAQLEKARADMQLLVKTFYDAQGVLKEGMSEDLFIEAVQTRLGLFGDATDQMTEFARQAARNMQDAMAEGFFDIMQGRFDKLGTNFKATLDMMVSNAIAADLSNRLLGDFGKTGKIGGWIGDLAGSSGSGLAGPTESGGNLSDGSGIFGWLASLVPKFAEGTPYVPRTGLALIHQGERIVPAAQNRGGFGGATVINNFSLQSPADRRTQEQVAALAGASIQRALARNN